jgi:hypothetical protein
MRAPEVPREKMFTEETLNANEEKGKEEKEALTERD